MKILGIESASVTASCAVLSDDVLLAEYTTNYKKTHSETLLPMVSEILRMTGTKPSDLTLIAVSEGPGSFTGLRIGAAAAKGLAFALDIPIVPVPTLDAIAYGMAGSACILCPMMDARRGEVYAGLYEFDGTELVILQKAEALPCTEEVRRAEEFAGERGKRVMYLGDGLPVFREEITRLTEGRALFALPQSVTQRAGSVAALGKVLYEQGVVSDAYTFSPLYLRKSQAEQEREAMGLSTEPDELSAKGADL
ncbi:MAG: tRNA (adenosine(37)-N6)-threonylcarbamoyltransferase complex dimerization subunit type 1 TsaB [Lachnospiraceae bacterium]|nr:tRNA (adenosine(37)-N6)-threonylcarbamoyltransferase complex dimerization subunit type 1 TsaB [Lachnospiraceae bacterium]